MLDLDGTQIGSAAYVDGTNHRPTALPSVGLVVALELDDVWNGRLKPLAEKDLEESAPFLSQILQALTVVPGFVWKRLIKRIPLNTHPGIVRIPTLLAAGFLPFLVFFNAMQLYEVLVFLGIFHVVALLVALLSNAVD